MRTGAMIETVVTHKRKPGTHLFEDCSGIRTNAGKLVILGRGEALLRAHDGFHRPLRPVPIGVAHFDGIFVQVVREAVF